MKKLFLISVLCVGMLLFSGVASATSFTFDMGDDSSVDTSGTNDVLQMYANINPNLDNILFTLDEGEAYSFYFATIGTTESWINDDDVLPGSLTANVDFDNPELVQSIGGTSVGFTAYWHFRQGWNLTWNDPVVVNFGSGGQFTIELDDVGYESWFWQGPDGTADVYATITLNSAPVPEPTTLLLSGLGLLGMGAYIRRKRSKK